MENNPLKIGPFMSTVLASFSLFIITIFIPHLLFADRFCANSISCIHDLSGNYQNQTQGEFQGKTVFSPRQKVFLPSITEVLGESTGHKQIRIDLSTQTLFAYQDNQLIYQFPISSGKWAPTPTGDFHIWIKLRYARMAGGNRAIGTFYDLPNVPNTMYFYNDQIPKTDGYGIHGAYWHNNFGHPMSHGCINEGLADAEKLFAWATPAGNDSVTYAADSNPGTEVVIYGQPPKSEIAF